MITIIIPRNLTVAVKNDKEELNMWCVSKYAWRIVSKEDSNYVLCTIVSSFFLGAHPHQTSDGWSFMS
jgi:hypothetical protein